MIEKTKPKAQAKAKPSVREKQKSDVQGKAKSGVEAKSKARAASSSGSASAVKVQVVHKISPPRVSSNGESRKFSSKGLRIPQYAYMKAPGLLHDFQVGDRVEVFCDHEKNRERIRGWVGGVVVQVDNKMVAVQFRSNVFLTDGWMVPDRILWYPLTSVHIRPVVGKKTAKREKAIPDY